MSAALKKSPLARVKDEFGGKDKLVDKIVGIIDSEDESKEDLRKRLLGVANGKLIRLHSVATRTKTAGGHDKLAAAAADKLKHGKDKDFVAKLGEYSNARLLDMLSVGERAQAAAAKPRAEKPARAEKPKAEKPAAKKAPAAKKTTKAK
ncbi:MAG TPA: hypothetical protein VKZ18_04370 [Polyangia bacterium]|nr:hypothetical protein [Polyangia bacterium]